MIFYFNIFINLAYPGYTKPDINARILNTIFIIKIQFRRDSGWVKLEGAVYTISVQL